MNCNSGTKLKQILLNVWWFQCTSTGFKKNAWWLKLLSAFLQFYASSVLLLTQLHWCACLVNCVLTGAQAVLQLGGSSLWRRGGTDSVDWVGGVYQRGGGSGRRGSRGPWGRRVRDFTSNLTAPTSSSTYWAGQTGASRSTNSKWSPAGQRREMMDVFKSFKRIKHHRDFCFSPVLT